MSIIRPINFIGVRGGGATTVHGSLATEINCGRLAPGVDVLRISDDLNSQNRRVMVEGAWPAATVPGGGEFMTFNRRARTHRTTTVAGADLALHRGRLRDLQGEVNVLVLNPTQDPEVARRSVPARAYWMQENLGLTPGQALTESLRQHFGLTIEELGRTRPKFLGRLGRLNQASRWSHDASQDATSARYPLAGLSSRDLKTFWQELEDIILGECRKVTYELHLLGAVLNGAEKLIVTFNRVEWLPTLPGVHFDYLGLAQKVVAPRPGVVYVAEKYVDYRLANDGESIEQLEGFSDEGPKLLWEAITAHLDSGSTPRPISPPTLSLSVSHSIKPRWQAIAGATLLPILVLMLAIFGGITTLLIALGVLGVAAAETALVLWAVREGAHTSIPEPEPIARPSSKVEIPAAIAQRASLPPGVNGHVCAHG